MKAIKYNLEVRGLPALLTFYFKPHGLSASRAYPLRTHADYMDKDRLREIITYAYIMAKEEKDLQVVADWLEQRGGDHKGYIEIRRQVLKDKSAAVWDLLSQQN